jgi:hypothetical protein
VHLPRRSFQRMNPPGGTPAVQYRPRPAGSLRLRLAGGELVQSSRTGAVRALFSCCTDALKSRAPPAASAVPHRPPRCRREETVSKSRREAGICGRRFRSSCLCRSRSTNFGKFVHSERDLETVSRRLHISRPEASATSALRVAYSPRTSALPSARMRTSSS